MHTISYKSLILTRIRLLTSHHIDYTHSNIMAFSFQGHTVIVTGAGGGLGKAYVSHQVPKDMSEILAVAFSYSLLFASRGANVVVNDFNPSAAEKVVDEITRGSLFVVLPPGTALTYCRNAP